MNVTAVEYAVALLSGGHNSLLTPVRIVSDRGRRTRIELGVVTSAELAAWSAFGSDVEAAELLAPLRGEMCGDWLKFCLGREIESTVDLEGGP
jgi:hypothetical protein